MKKLTESQIEEAVSRYQDGQSFKAIGDVLGVSDNAIRGLLKRRGVAGRTLSDARRTLACNHAFFDEPMDEQRAYWLGFILADGAVTESGYGVTKRLSVILSIVDKGHLEKLKVALQSDHKLTEIKRDGVVISARFMVSSTELFTSLARYSIVPCKSAKHQFSGLIPTNMLKHYFRGYFDGNGGISRSKASKWAISNCASEEFLSKFLDWIESRIGGNRAGISFHDGIHRVAWAGTHRCQEILDLMYRNATVYLDRKMELYREICSDAATSSRGAYNRK